MTRLGLCCISLDLQDKGYKFQTITFKRFSSLPRDEALEILGERILNNLVVTNEIIKYCAENDWCYRMSSDIFPLITYAPAQVDLIDLPNIDSIYDQFEIISKTRETTGVRLSTHPGPFCVLASPKPEVATKTIDELNFYSSFMDIIGCPADHSSPINLHINCSPKHGSYNEIIESFMSSFNRLDPNCRNRLTVECDDKSGGWSVQELIEHFNPATNIPITFDYLHHKCNPSYDEQTAVELCHATWDTKPLFHYSESRPGNNPRAHCDVPTEPFNTYGLDFDVDMEVKMKDRAIALYQELYPTFADCQQPIMVAD